MIDNLDEDNEDYVALICDDCGKEQEFRSFSKAIAFKKKQRAVLDGWRCSNDGGVWKDHCPDCARAYREKMGRGDV